MNDWRSPRHSRALHSRGLLVGGGLLVGLGVAAARGASGLPFGLWRCPMRQLTGVPCPTCYLTRSVLATLRGDLAQALQWHAFGPVMVALALALGVWLLSGRRLPVRPGLQGACLLATLALGYWLWRLWGWSQGQPLPG